MNSRQYTLHENVTSYLDTLYLATYRRCDADVNEVVPAAGEITLRFTSTVSDSDLRCITDLAQATGRDVVSTSDTELTLDVQSGGDHTVLLEERVSELFCCDSPRGEQVGELTASEIEVEMDGRDVIVHYPSATSNTDLSRLDDVLLSYGRVRE
jgi:hypothetical protein